MAAIPSTRWQVPTAAAPYDPTCRRGTICAGKIGPGDDDEFFADQALGLEPQALLAREVWLIDPLRHDALDTQLAGMLSEERASPTTW